MISDNDIQFIISQRQPLSKGAQKIISIIEAKNGIVKCTHSRFCRAIGLENQIEAFYKRLDECIEKDYVRIYDYGKIGKENLYCSFEYFHSTLLPKIRNPEISQFHTQYIQQKRQEVQVQIIYDH